MVGLDDLMMGREGMIGLRVGCCSDGSGSA